MKDYVMRCPSWHHLYNLENIKNTLERVLLLQPTTSLKVTLFRGCFSRVFLHCTYGTESLKFISYSVMKTFLVSNYKLTLRSYHGLEYFFCALSIGRYHQYKCLIKIKVCLHLYKFEETFVLFTVKSFTFPFVSLLRILISMENIMHIFNLIFFFLVRNGILYLNLQNMMVTLN